MNKVLHTFYRRFITLLAFVFIASITWHNYNPSLTAHNTKECNITSAHPFALKTSFQSKPTKQANSVIRVKALDKKFAFLNPFQFVLSPCFIPQGNTYVILYHSIKGIISIPKGFLRGPPYAPSVA